MSAEFWCRWACLDPLKKVDGRDREDTVGADGFKASSCPAWRGGTLSVAVGRQHQHR